ncbi:LysE family translocator [Ktedonosporobacter rubrisoli]|uniref:LysE family translocator n=1 Tax=Ktedonosporobacter rubrisoli TaxID=2509675 RepID=A0A4P6JM89_KTERU|nr:LysE family translocator [Ktedonosporobacter rubrisoli]QBD76223.1 LysE family translocator [Ktedonosporobacter rubrisoli]
MFAFFMRGLLIGLPLAATIGPMSILCIQRTLHKGYRYGLASSLGVASADATYGSIAGFGLTVLISLLLSWQFWIHLLGGMALIFLGVKILLSRPAEKAATERAHNLPGAYLSTYLLTLANPLTILWFSAIFASIGSGLQGSYAIATVVVIGIFCGSATGICLVTGCAWLLRSRFTSNWLLWINRASGALIVLFGLFNLLNHKL